MQKLSKIMTVCLSLGMMFFSNNTEACTGIQVKAKDGTYINGRTLEFGIPLMVAGLIVPRNYTFNGTLPDGSNGMSYRSKYAAVGGNMFGEPAIADGLNEKGLSMGAFYFPGFAGFSPVTPQTKAQSLSPTQFVNWVLTQFANVDEVKNGLKNVSIVATKPNGWPVIPPMHYVVYDKTGKSIVIEPIDGQLKVYDNLTGVMTNSPDYEWHTTNLSNYVNLSPLNVPPLTFDGLKLAGFGQGSGLRGMPGDFTSPSRFIRATVFSLSAIPVDNGNQAVLQVFHILNQFDIPKGAVRDINQNVMYPEYTMVTTVKDPVNSKYYYRTYQDQGIKMINMNAFNLDGNQLKNIPMDSIEQIMDVSGQAR
jgi:choloylglycine hydrolase